MRASPSPFPEDLPPRYREPALREAFLEAFANTQIPGELRAIDCTEYPCVVYGEMTFPERGPEVEERFHAFEQALKARYPDAENRFSIHSSGFHDQETGGERRYFGISILPKEGTDDEVKRRAMHRRLR